MSSILWSAFSNVGANASGDTIVGLRTGVNVQFNPTTPAQVQASSFTHGTDTGIADAYTVALSPAVTSYTDGLQVSFTPTHENATTTPTLALNGLAAKTIVLSNGALSASDLTTSMIALCIYSTAAGAFVLLTPA